MTAPAAREEISVLATQVGWQWADHAINDYYFRNDDSVRVIWGHNTINGGALYSDGILMAYTRDIETVKAWLKR